LSSELAPLTSGRCVYIAFDQDANQAGQRAPRLLARRLQSAGLQARIERQVIDCSISSRDIVFSITGIANTLNNDSRTDLVGITSSNTAEVLLADGKGGFNPVGKPWVVGAGSTIITTFQFHLTLGRELAQTLDETPLLAGLNPAAYEQWRSENKLVDNLSNRFRYASLVAGAD
jgi:hypothetical protein